MTFGVGAGARAVLRTTVTIVTVETVLLLRWVTESLWSLTPMVVGVFLIVWYVPWVTDSFYGEMDDTRIYMRYGVLWRWETVVPLSALRTFETWASPLDLLFHCRTVVLRFAGGCAVLPLLDEEIANRLTARLEEC